MRLPVPISRKTILTLMTDGNGKTGAGSCNGFFSERKFPYTILYRFIDNENYQQFKVNASTEKEAIRQFHSKMDPISHMLEHDASGLIMVRIDHSWDTSLNHV